MGRQRDLQFVLGAGRLGFTHESSKPIVSRTHWPGRLLVLVNPWMRGSDVEQVQKSLVDRGFAVDVDGIYGPQTRDAVINFQKKFGLEVDGVVGPLTWTALFADRTAM